MSAARRRTTAAGARPPRRAAPAGEPPAATGTRKTLTAPLGQRAPLQRTLAAARRLRMHHGLIVSGPPGAGLGTVARWIAAALLCPSTATDPAAPCGICRTCRRVASGQHPDLHVLAPLEDRRDIAIEQVRQVQDELLRLPVEGRARVVLLDPASALNEQGQNALLKTLEEPGADTFLLLVTARPEALLPTVRSRCERLRVLRLADEVVARQLRQRLPQAAAHHAAAVAFAQGRLGAALAACTERMVQLHDLVQQLAADSKALRPFATARAVLAGSDGPAGATAKAREFLWRVRNLCSGRLRALAAGSAATYVAAAAEPWASLLEATLFAEQDLDLRIPPEQALTGLLLEWQRLLRAHT